MSFSEYFKTHFYDAMLKPNHPASPVRDRATSFLKVFQILDERKTNGQDYFNIIETGTSRPDHGKLCFGDDGCGTYILDKFVNYYDGQVTSVDISETACKYSDSITSEKTKVFVEDSVSYLWSLPVDFKIDLLYLDSFDITKEDPHPSMLHHIKEMCAVIKNLKKGSIVVVDDHDAFFTDGKIGKGLYVKDFMNDIGAKLIFEGYQIGWVL